MKKLKNGKAAYVVVFAIALVLAGIVIFTNSPETARTVSAQSDLSQQKKYRGTRRIVKDETTGEFRLPTQEEGDKTVADLARLTKRPDDLPSSTSPQGGISMNLDEGFAGTFVARPAADGSMETRCVFTLEEGLEFLGFVEVAE